jgi:thiol-disulfide isomerase/thioredoxin
VVGWGFSWQQGSVNQNNVKELCVKKKRKQNNKRLKWLVAPLLLIGAVTLYYVNSSSSAPAPRLVSSTPKNAAPQFTLSDLNGRPVSLSDYRGKVVILDFWAPWCPPCKREIPDLISLQDQYGPKGLQVVGIGLDRTDNVTTFVRENGVNYPVMVGDDEITRLYGGIPGIPTTFIVDKEGNISKRFEGFTDRSVFEAAIRKLL